MSVNVIYKPIIPHDWEEQLLAAAANPETRRNEIRGVPFQLYQRGGDYTATVVWDEKRQCERVDYKGEGCSGSIMVYEDLKRSSDRLSHYVKETDPKFGPGVKFILYLGCKGEYGLKPRVREIFVPDAM